MTWLETVRTAQRGDTEAFEALVRRFQDHAAAVAWARTGDPAVAEEVAQEAFLAAWRHLGQLREPAGFPGWLRRIVVKQADRVTRRRRRDTVPLRAVEAVVGADDDPSQVAEDRALAALVRAAVARLPEHQRAVVALFYLSDRSHDHIAAFLEIEVGTVKKRLHDARRRLKEGMEMQIHDWLEAHRPSRDDRLPLAIRARIAVRAGDAHALREALDARPDLVRLRGETHDEGLRQHYAPLTGGATLLHEAAMHGDPAIVALLVDRGAALEATTRGGETALHVAAQLGHEGAVDVLLDRGAHVDAPMWHGGTPLHLARMRGHDGVAHRLSAAGADPTVRTIFGQTADDWRRGGATTGRIVGPDGIGLDGGPRLRVPAPVSAAPALRATGIKAVDLLAPLTRGGLHRIHAGAGVGKIVLLGELMDRFDRCVLVGFAERTLDVRELEPVLRELGVYGHTTIVLGTRDEAGALARTALGLAGDGLLVADEALEPLLRGQGVTTVLFGPHVEPATVPELGDAQARIVLDAGLAAQRLFPAVDPHRSESRTVVSERHARLAAEARQALAEGSARGERLQRYLTQPFRVAEPFNGRPGTTVDPAALLDDVEALLAGACDDRPVDDLAYIGSLETAGSWTRASGGWGL